MSRGTNNQTFLVGWDGQRWVLRISQNLSADQVAAEHRLLERLGHEALPFRVPEPVATRGGDTVVATPAGPATLCRWIPGQCPDLAGEPALERFGRMIGVLSEALRHVPARDAPHDWLAGPLHADPDLADPAALAAALRAGGLSDERLPVFDRTVGHLSAWQARDGGDLPVQVVHGDLNASNMLTDERSGLVTGVLDFEVAGLDYRVQDLVAGLVQAGALDGPHWRERTAAVIRGHARIQALTGAEIESVPDLIAGRLAGSALWRTARWRRGDAHISEVADRLDRLCRLDAWLAAHGDELRSVIACC